MTGQKLLQHKVPSFENRLATIADFLVTDTFHELRDEILGLVDIERSYLPVHKKGGTVGYAALRNRAPQTIALYTSPEFQGFLSQIVGDALVQTPERDESSLSVLFYDRPGDHIAWHYDRKFYQGRHFTVLIGIENVNSERNGLSAAKLLVNKNGTELEIPTPPNVLIIFEGAHTLHRVTPLASGERRVMLSMTFTTDARNTVVQELERRVKDIAFFGLRALWT